MGTLPVGRLALAAALIAGCAKAPLKDRPCPCEEDAGYTCCNMQVCLGPGEVCPDPTPWTIPGVPDGRTPLPMENVTVFAFSSVDMNGASLGGEGRDQQVMKLKPDMVIRGWGQWDWHGINKGDYESSFLKAVQGQGTLFMGGGTATALFEDQDMDHFETFVTLDVAGHEVPHSDLNDKEFRGSLANEKYRNVLLFKYGKFQIDAGVDGLQYTEVNADYNGASTNDGMGGGDYNEGFDPAHLADFNAFLLAKYQDPGERQKLLERMPSSNRLRADVPPGNLDDNFNFARYLRDKNWQGCHASPAASADPLCEDWGTTRSGSPAFGAETFVDNAEPYHYWRALVEQLRKYARDTYGKEIFISANGMFPFVDFISQGIYDSPTNKQSVFQFTDATDGSGKPWLEGSHSLQDTIRNTWMAQASLVAPGAPVVLYLDGPWPKYHDLPVGQRQDFWKIYTAEAYANGAFFAFLLKPPPSSSTEDPATADGADDVLDVFQQLAKFYKTHEDLYHGATPAPDEDALVATGATPGGKLNVMTALNVQPSMASRRIVHVVNHQYDPTKAPDSGIIPQHDVSLTIPVDAQPSRVDVYSPDFVELASSGGPVSPTPSMSDAGTIVVTLKDLVAYDVVVISY